MARKKKDRRSQQKSSGTLPRRVTERLHDAARLLSAGQPGRARDLLEELERRYPNNQDILLHLTNVYYDLKDAAAFQAACERLVAIQPSAAFTLMLAGAYLTNLMPLLALRTFRRFLERWPDHPRAGEARKTLADLQSNLDELLAGLHLTGPDALEVATLHEEVQSLLGQAKYPEARRKAEELLQRRPDFLAALNNISQAYAAEGQMEQAIATAHRTLESDPENVHALSNLTRFLYISGRTDEAKACAAQLKAAPPKGFDVWTKKAEAFSYLGDDQAVLDVLQEFELAADTQRQRASPYLLHFAAVANFRLGHEEEARRRWKKALRLQPGFALANANLDDLRKPVGERHAPWPFPFNHWVAKKLRNELIADYNPARFAALKQSDSPPTANILRSHPELATLLPILLERGDPPGREFALRTALMARTPEMLALLRDFALSQHGPDSLRSEAAEVAVEAGLLPPGPVRLWIQGEWREIVLLGWEVTGEPFNRHGHSQSVQQLLAEAFEALHEGKAEHSEALYKEALKLEPDSPDLLNNLAAAYQSQGRHAEAEALIRQIHERFPDYLFARVGMAKFHIRDGRFAEAKELLDPLLSQRRFHTSEFAALAAAEIDYWLAQKNKDAARPWLEVWERTVPDSPMLAVYREKFRPRRWRDSLPW